MKPRLLVLVAVLVLAGWLFGPMLVGGRLPAFRDTADFYYPLFKLERDEWRAGRVPLWNPYSNLGMPLAATGTASTFYPGKLIFQLPLDYDWAFRLYLAGHVLLAAGTAYRLARYLGANVEGAGIAALSYAFSGNVLFQYCNLVFLVGAAWLPAALEAALRMLRQRSLRWAVVFGLVLALLVLGGDPQAAYHGGLLALAAALCLVPAARAPHALLVSLGLLAVAALTAATVAAVQILPTAEMAARSDRAASWTARSLYEIPSALARDRSGERIAGGLLGAGEEGTHHERVYRYSVHPGRLVEYVFPNVNGRQFPFHRRWNEPLVDKDGLWVPSFYMGLLPLVLALSALRFRRADPTTVLLSWTVLLAAWAGLGRYGGLYWLMNVVLPGYIEFRYPAKLLVVAALGLSMLAGLGWDRAATRTWRYLLGLSGLSIAAACLLLAFGPWWWPPRVEPDPLFGPLDAGGAFWDLAATFLQTALVALTAWWIFGRLAAGRRWPGAAAIALVTADLAVANGWLVATAPSEAWLARADSRLQDNGESLGLLRALRHETWLPDAWSATASPDRLEELIRWNRRTSAPHHHLTQRLGLLEVYGTMSLADYDLLCSSARDPDVLRGKRELPAATGSPPDKAGQLWNALGAERLILPGGISGNPGAYPRAWIVHDLVCLPPLWSRDPAGVVRRSAEVLRADGRPRDFRRQAVVETDRPIDVPPGPAPAFADERDTCRVVGYQPDRVEIEAELRRPGLLVLSDQFYPGWQLTVTSAVQNTRPAEILRTNRVMRGVWLAPGRHRLVYRYRPAAFFIGAGVSALALATSLGLMSMAVSVRGARLKRKTAGRLSRPVDT